MTAQTKIQDIARTDLWFKQYDTCVTINVRGSAYMRWYTTVKDMLNRMASIQSLPRELKGMTESEIHHLFNFMTRFSRVRREFDKGALRGHTGMTDYKVYCNYDDPCYLRVLECASDSGYTYTVQRITETHPGVIRTKIQPRFRHRMYLKPHGGYGEDLTELRNNLREFLIRNQGQIFACSALQDWIDYVPPSQWSYKPVLPYYFVEYDKPGVATMLGLAFPEIFSPRQFTLEHSPE